MITYLKNMEGWKHKDLKSKDFNSIKELFDKAFKRVNMFMDYKTDLVEAEVDDDQEAAKIKELMEIVPDEEEVSIDAILLATNPPTILSVTGVNAASEEVSTAELVSTAYVICMRYFGIRSIEVLKWDQQESSNNHFKEANNKLAKTNQLMFKELKKFQAELDRYHDVNYMSKVEIDCAKAKDQTILEMKKELIAHQESISIMSQEKETQKKFCKTREYKEIEKVIALENNVKFLKKAQRANPRLYDIGCYNDNLDLMLAPESDETIRLAQESRSH
ncbi:hypothetical protein Tco_0117341 [Tanacetum coccineum]